MARIPRPAPPAGSCGSRSADGVRCRSPNNTPRTSRARTVEQFGERRAGWALEHPRLPTMIQFSLPLSNRRPVADGIVGSGAEDDWVLDFPGTHNEATRPVVPEVDLVQRPEFHSGVGVQRREFLVHRLQFRVRVREHRGRLSETEPELAEQSLALADAEADREPPLKGRGEGLAIPEMAGEAGIFRSLTESHLDRLQLDLRELPGVPRCYPRVGPPALLRRTDGPNTGRSVGNRPGAARPEVRSFLGRRGVVRGVDDHIGTHRMADPTIESEEHVPGVKYGQRSHGKTSSHSYTRYHL